ncbi:mitochondrial ribosome-associated GTPase 1 isoform X8 [Enhydra lutris kenyoni]|uniref:Mitochondrial ribosome-associated GTPase 1 isoform X8 n=1 Tax=Enhydra lutris kenyoni TaxID=391180 RepID=A0A2Y9J268_ENHLU|nr:mitochondrial ribosome-associated GTPase 1 isoform X8 [Enhydra lutris kenyoni]
MRVALHALCGAAGAAWRESFPLGGRDVARWFPGHMAKGLKKMQSSLKLVDCIIEVHDARIPLSGRNPLFQETLGLKPHVLVLNKMDLADLKEQQVKKIIQHLEGEGLKNVVFTSCVKDENIKQVMPLVRGLVEGSYRYHRGENLEYCAMVIGIPNVGKSSLINALRRQHLGKGKATRVGGEPGITRAVMSRIQVCDWPLMFLLDTPGVLSPRIESVEMGLKLALCDRRPQTADRGLESLPPRQGCQEPQRLRLSREGSLECQGQEDMQGSAWPPASRNRAGPPGGGGDPGRLPSLHPQQAPALWTVS